MGLVRQGFICLLCAVWMVACPPVVRAAEEIKIALVMKALSNPFFAKMEAGAKDYADAHRIPMDVFGIERETEVDRQIGIIENLIARGEHEAIVLAPADSIRLVPVCKKALDKGIKVINIDNPLHQGAMDAHGIIIPFVGSDNYQGASMVGSYLRRKMGNKGRMLVIEGIRGVENADLRKNGFIQAVTSDDSRIQVIASESASWHTVEAFALVNKLWEKYGPVDGIFCANDSMALGALQALDVLTGADGKVWLGGYDNIEAVRNEMRHGRVHATVEQHPELMGEIGVQLAVEAVRGKTIPRHTTTPLDLITYESFNSKIALSLPSLKNPFFDVLQRGARKAADLFGAQLTVKAQDDDAQQIVDLQVFVEEKMNVVIVTPTDAETAAPGIELLNGGGIPVITLDRRASSGKVLCHIASDNVAGGRMAGEFLVQQLGGKGNVVELEGSPGASASNDRNKGFNEVLARYADIKVVGRKIAYFEREKAKEAIHELMEEAVSFDAVFAHNDAMILGTLDALKAVGARDRPPVLIGFDGTAEARQAIEENHLRATIAQKPEEMGRMAVQIAIQVIRGETPPALVHVGLELIEKK